MDQACPTCKRPFRGVIEAFDSMRVDVTAAVAHSEHAVDENTKMLGSVAETQRGHAAVLQEVSARLSALKEAEKARELAERDTSKLSKLQTKEHITLKQQRQEIMGKVAHTALTLTGGILMVVVSAWVAWYFDVPIPVLPGNQQEETDATAK